MFLGVVALEIKNENNQKTNKKIVHLYSQSNGLPDITIDNANNLFVGNLLFVTPNEDGTYSFEKLEGTFINDDQILLQINNLIEAEKEMLKKDRKIFIHNFGDFGQLGDEIFYNVSSRFRVISLLEEKLKNNQKKLV